MTRRRGIRIALLGAALLLVIVDPRGLGAGWRAAFLIGGAVPAGAVALLLVARLTDARWGAALVPPARGAWLTLPGVAGVALEQWLFRPAPAHLALWLSPVPFLLRGAFAGGLWTLIAARQAALTRTGAGLALLAHAFALALVAPDWLLGVAPGQPYSAIPMVLGAGQILAACAAALIAGLGDAAARRDLALLMLAAALGLGYLCYVDYLVVWYGDIPARVGYYASRTQGAWGVVALTALGLGLALPIAAVIARRLRVAAAGAAAGWALLVDWLVLPGSGIVAPVAAALLVGALTAAA